jgi:hypothetical protein
MQPGRLEPAISTRGKTNQLFHQTSWPVARCEELLRTRRQRQTNQAAAATNQVPTSCGGPAGQDQPGPTRPGGPGTRPRPATAPRPWSAGRHRRCSRSGSAAGSLSGVCAPTSRVESRENYRKGSSQTDFSWPWFSCATSPAAVTSATCKIRLGACQEFSEVNW